MHHKGSTYENLLASHLRCQVFVPNGLIPGQRQGLVPVCGHTVVADFLASSDGGHTGTEVF